jgi:hypothetical protein
MFSRCLFAVNNFDKFETNNSVHMINASIKDHLPISVMHLSDRCVYSILPTRISTLRNEKKKNNNLG